MVVTTLILIERGKKTNTKSNIFNLEANILIY